VYSQRFEEALLFAAQLHREQRRKGSNTPYVGHLLAVAALVIENGGGEDQVIAALLHDAIEDQGGDATRREIQRRFGDAVAAIVEGCTDADTIPKPPWRERKEAYIRHLRSQPEAVRLVSAADKLHNARSIVRDYRIVGEKVWEMFRGGREGTLWYYRALVTVLGEGARTPVIDELERVVSEMERLAGDGAP
jgi:(p)ppGpp synthase/HD superfamily hydrolase